MARPRTRSLATAAGIVLAVLAARPVAAASVEIEVLLVGPDGAEGPAPDAVVWIPGLEADPAARHASPATLQSPAIVQRDKTFVPRVTVVGTGTSVAFPNEDPIFHNVFSLSTSARFDMGLYRNGESRDLTFERPGLVPIYCNIHPQMVAYARVVDSEVFARTGDDGRARLEGVPDGTHELHVWHERGGEWSGTVTTPAGGAGEPLRVVLDASSWRLLPHKNKYGRDYPPPDEEDDFRY